jgi:low affinity Fe/Cu permease
MNSFFDRFEAYIMTAVGSVAFVVLILDLLVWRP